MKYFKLDRTSTWIAIILIFVNIFNWVRVLSNSAQPYTVEGIRDPEVVALLAYIYAGDHAGENWEITLTDLEAEQTITWYLEKYPQIPFAHPQIEITPDYIAGEGDATISGLRVHVGAKVRVTLQDGLPVVDILALSLPIPGPIREAIEREIQVQLQHADLLPVRFLSAEWRENEVLVQGVIR